MQVITKSCLGGAQSVVINLVNHLCELGHEVIVVAGPEDGKMWHLIHPKAIKVTCHKLQRAVSPLKDFQALLSLKSIYRKYRPDVVHIHSSKAGLLSRLAFPSKKIVYTVHGFDSIRLSFKVFLPLEKRMQGKCASIVGVSKYDIHNMRDCKILKNVSCIYNGISLPTKDEQLVWNIPRGKYDKTILCIARMEAPKRHDLFLEVAESLPNYAFVWIGNSEEVKEHPSNTFFLGNIPNAGRYCQMADLFMLASDYEGLPMVILEAMSYGLPVIASNVGGISEIIENGKNGYTVQNTVEDFKEHILKVLDNDDLSTQMKEYTLHKFETELTATKMVENYMTIYQRIAAK